MAAPNRNPDLHGAVPDHADVALLIIDMLSDFEFQGGDALFRGARPVAQRIARLRVRARAAGVPTIYVNDNHGRWRSDLSALLRHCSRKTVRGAPIARLLRPAPTDYCVLKPKHSGFYATALGTLLEYLGATRLILTGASSHQCVLFTANDAYVRDLALCIPRDCICSATDEETRFALRYFESVLGADVRPSRAVQFAPVRTRGA